MSLANWAQASTSTTGTAATLTVSPVSGWPTPWQVAPNRPIHYTIMSAAGTPIEAGIGRASSATTFERDMALDTWDGTTFSANPSGLAALSGTCTLMCTVLADSVVQSPRYIDTTVYGNGFLNPGPQMPENLLAESDFPAQLLTAGMLYLVPWLKTANNPISKLGVNVTAAAAGKVISVGIYEDGPLGMPIGSSVASANGVSVAATGLIMTTLAAPVSLPPGWYWSAVISDGTPAISGATFTLHAGITLAGTRRWRFFRRTSTYGPLSGVLPGGGTPSAVVNEPAPGVLWQ